MAFGETETANQIKPGNFAPFNEWTLIGRKLAGIEKSGLSRKLKVSTLDIQIKQSGLKD